MADPDRAPIQIVVADKSPLVQAGLTHLFGNDDRFELVAMAPDGERFMEAVERKAFHVGIIGWDMPGLDGRGVLEAVKTLGPDAPRIIVYTGNPSQDAPRMAMHLGGAGFCSKSDPLERLVEVVLAVADGRMVFPFMDVSRINGDPLANLTGREYQLLSSLSRGRTNAQIAHDLDISLNTVKFHLKNLYSKLDVQNRAQAVAYYMSASGRDGG